MSIGSIYQHFGGRDGIVLMLYKRCMSDLLGAISAEALKPRSAKGMVLAIVR